MTWLSSYFRRCASGIRHWPHAKLAISPHSHGDLRTDIMYVCMCICYVYALFWPYLLLYLSWFHKVYNLYMCGHLMLASFKLEFCAIDHPHSSFEPLYPKVFRGTTKVDLESTIWPQAPPKVRRGRFVCLKKAVFRCFLDEIKSILPAKWSISVHSMWYIFWKLIL